MTRLGRLRDIDGGTLMIYGQLCKRLEHPILKVSDLTHMEYAILSSVAAWWSYGNSRRLMWRVQLQRCGQMILSRSTSPHLPCHSGNLRVPTAVYPRLCLSSSSNSTTEVGLPAREVALDAAAHPALTAASFRVELKGWLCMMKWYLDMEIRRCLVLRRLSVLTTIYGKSSLQQALL